MSNFYNDIKKLINIKNLDEAKEKLLVYFGENTNDPIAIGMYLECLLLQKEFAEIDGFVSSLDEEMKESELKKL